MSEQQYAVVCTSAEAGEGLGIGVILCPDEPSAWRYAALLVLTEIDESLEAREPDEEIERDGLEGIREQVLAVYLHPARPGQYQALEDYFTEWGDPEYWHLTVEVVIPMETGERMLFADKPAGWPLEPPRMEGGDR